MDKYIYNVYIYIHIYNSPQDCKIGGLRRYQKVVQPEETTQNESALFRAWREMWP